jgi:hypothetical protein
VAAAAGLENALGKHVRRPREHCIDIAEAPAQRGGAIVRRVLVHLGRIAVERGAEIRQNRQRLVIDRDELAGILGGGAVLGDDHHDCFAHIMRGRGRKHMLGAVLLDQRRRREQRHRPLGRVEIARGEHRDDARKRCSRTRLDRLDTRVSVGRAHERGLQRVGQRDVVEIAAAAGEEIGILDARHPCAEIARAHCHAFRRADAA